MKTTISVWTLAVLFLVAGCQTVQITSSRMASPPSIDGSLNDWPNGSEFLIDDGRMALTITNDRQHLYLGGVVTDKALQRVIRMQGLTIWLDPDGGRSKRIEIRIPAAAEGSFDERRGGFWASYTVEQQEHAAEKLSALLDGVLVRNRRNDRYTVFPAGGDGPITMVSSQVDDQQVYEVRLPLQFQSDFLSFGQPAGSGIITLGVEITRIPDFRRDAYGPGADPGFGRTRFDREEYWLEVSLAN
ncbi:MAG TPA: hypothetical protein VKA68_02325 [bacterium]|nr:hypothetical protein [bacterium]